MTEQITLRVFWVFMLLCAGSALTQLWSAGELLPNQVVPTLFIIGFASFLIWAPLMAYKFLEKFEVK